MPSILSLLIFIYIGFISVHLFCCFFAMENPRMLTKIFLMPFLSLIYYKATPKEKFSKSIFAAIIFGFLGDVILLGDNGFLGDVILLGDNFIPLILLGIVFFFFGHLLYTINFIIQTGLKFIKNIFYFL